VGNGQTSFACFVFQTYCEREMPSSDEDSDSLSDDSGFEESTEEQKEGGVS